MTYLKSRLIVMPQFKKSLRLIITCRWSAVLCAASADTIVVKNGDRICDAVQQLGAPIETGPSARLAMVPGGGRSEPPTIHTRLAGTGPLRARIVSNGALDPAAIRAIEQEGVNHTIGSG